MSVYAAAEKSRLATRPAFIADPSSRKEESLLANLNFFIQILGIPYIGIGNLKWDEKLLSQGVVSISKLTVIFPTGELVDVPDNGSVNSFDLNLSGLNQVTLYLHLLKDSSQQDIFAESMDEEDKSPMRLISLHSQMNIICTPAR